MGLRHGFQRRLADESRCFRGAAVLEKLPLARIHNLRIVNIKLRGHPFSSDSQHHELTRVGIGKKIGVGER